jgi:hypothetical protein
VFTFKLFVKDKNSVHLPCPIALQGPSCLSTCLSKCDPLWHSRTPVILHYNRIRVFVLDLNPFVNIFVFGT